MTCHIENDTMSCHVMSCQYDMTFIKFTKYEVSGMTKIPNEGYFRK